jgi:hypothetical protein
VDQLESWGDRALRNGVAKWVYETLLCQSHKDSAYWTWNLPRITPGWDKPESTLPRKLLQDHAEGTRHALFMNHQDNTCGPDAILVAGILSGAGIRRADAVAGDAFLALSSVQMLFRSLLTQPWGTQTQNYRDNARNLLNSAIQEELKKTNHHHSDGQTDVTDLMEHTFKGFPSYSFTMAHGTRCCNITYIGTPINSRRVTTIAFLKVNLPGRPTYSISHHINEFFAPERKGAITLNCQEPQCAHRGQRVNAVLDRFPPALAITLGTNAKLSANPQVKYFNKFTVEYYKAGRESAPKTASFLVEGVILRTGMTGRKFAKPHYVVQWLLNPHCLRGSEEHITVDPITSVSKSKVERFGEGVDPGSTDVCVLFCVRSK